MSNRSGRRSTLDARLIRAVCDRLDANLRLRRTLPGSGRIDIDRQVPFLIVYRPPRGRDEGTGRLVVGEAAYLLAPTDRRSHARLHELTSAVVGKLSEVFGGFLLIEVWAGPPSPPETGAGPPGFRVVAARRLTETPTVEQLQRSLRRIRVQDMPAQVSLSPGGRLSPPGFSPLLSAGEARRLGCQQIGIEVRPIYRDPATGSEYPLLRRVLHRQFARALREACFVFALRETKHRPRHYQALGRRAFVKAAWEVDRQLAEISSRFDLVLMVSPANTEAAFRAFTRSRHSKPPLFVYRPHESDPATLKRRLYNVPIERVEDPTLTFLFNEKRRELDLKLSLLADRTTDRFLHTGIALYGDVDPGLCALARSLLEELPPRADRKGQTVVDAVAFAARARQEVDRYRERLPGLASQVVLSPDTSTLVVSRGHLLVGQSMSFPARRVEALIQHEVGTHILTFANAKAQPFRLLVTGLARYDALQEGLGVFAEYLVGGLTEARLRTLAARVLSARAVADGADFVETYRELRDSYHFERRPAFMITMRVHRGGGFVKDAIYLRGLRTVMDHVREGGSMETLLVGKIAAEHVPIVEELRRREVLKPPPLRPTYLDAPGAAGRLEAIRNGMGVSQLARSSRPPTRSRRGTPGRDQPAS